MNKLAGDPDRFDLSRCTRDEIALLLAEAALAAGPAVMEEYQRGCDVHTKEDGSPVTSADYRAETIVCRFLSRALPSTPLVSEERAAAGDRIGVAARFLLVDPLDGTREFLARNGEFTINVALIERGVPIAGAVYAPALGRLWAGGEHAFVCEAPPGAELPEEAKRRVIRARQAPPSLVALVSRSHLDSHCEVFLKGLPVGDERSIGSSLKFCLLAEGLGDVYPRFAPTMEWDTAAGDAVLRAAGGIVLDTAGGPLVYGKFESGLRNGSFVAWGDASAARQFDSVNAV